MFTLITLISLFTFAITYPLCFWLSADDPLENNFHHFHIGLPNLIAGLAVLGLFLVNVDMAVRIYGLAWLLIFFAAAFVSWSKNSVSPKMITAVSFCGVAVFSLVYDQLIAVDPWAIAFSIFTGLILSVAFYAMNLGHWYLNVQGLSLHHLKRSVIAFVILLIMRLLHDVLFILKQSIFFGGELVPLPIFLQSFDGLFLWIGLVFGVVFPLIALYFVWGTLQVKSTQSATGILFVLLAGILIGDLTFKYYLLQTGILL